MEMASDASLDSYLSKTEREWFMQQGLGAILSSAAKEQVMGLPQDDKGRKALPIFRGPLMYFPDALLAIAAVCKAGNDQHNPGQPLHWAREKSTEQMDTALRHMMDHGLGNLQDTDGTWHLAKAAWRLLAELQLTIERERKPAMDPAPPSAWPMGAP